MAMPIPSMTGGAGGASGPATGGNVSTSTNSGVSFDNSGWTVSTGSSKADAVSSKSDLGLGALPWYVYVGVLAVVGLYLWKK